MKSGRKWGAIDLLNLYTKSNEKLWMKVMHNCYKSRDITRLQKLLYGIQLGMDNLVKNKMDSPKIQTFFIWLQRVLEKTAKAIYRELYPSPLDNPAAAGQLKKFDQVEYQKWIKIKRKRDEEFEKWRRGASF